MSDQRNLVDGPSVNDKGQKYKGLEAQYGASTAERHTPGSGTAKIRQQIKPIDGPYPDGVDYDLPYDDEEAENYTRLE